MNNWKTLRRLLHYTGDARRQYLWGLIGLGAVNCWMNLIFALGLSVFAKALMSHNSRLLTGSVILFGCVGISSALFILLAARALTMGATRTEGHLRSALFASVNAMSIEELERRSPGDILSRLNNDVAEVGKMYRNTLQNASVILIFGVGSAVASILIDWRAGLLIVGSASLMFFLTLPLLKPLRHASLSTQQSKADVLNDIGESVRGSAVIRSFGLAQWIIDHIRSSSSRQRNAGMQLGTLEATRTIVEAFGDIVVFVLMGYGAYRGAMDHTFIPKLFALIQVTNGVIMLFTQLSAFLSDLQANLVAGRRVLELIDVPAEPDRLTAPTATVPVERHGLAVQELGFSYHGASGETIHDISFTVRKGTTAAFVGPSGGGKSTLIKLLLGLYRPDRGTVTIESESIYGEDLKAWRHHFAYVPQNAFIFSDTVYNNILGGMADPGQKTVEDAARAANAHEFIMQLPQGYQTVLEESGRNLSGGQRQRIAIARAILQNAPILLLDEATSALDAENEQQVQEALERLMRGRTTLVIAHRLSTIQNAEMIYYLEGGQLMEKGTHAELMQRKSKYRALVEAGLRTRAAQI